jgi:hypothetical protein
MRRFVETEVTDWAEIHSLHPLTLSQYVFRGQRCASWELTTSLERAYGDLDEDLRCRIPVERYEQVMLCEFRRKYHLYASDAPSEDDRHGLEWHAVMQHHGAPTLLLDFTKSPFVAAYFALDGAKSDAAVWAVNESQLCERVRRNTAPGLLLDDTNLASRRSGMRELLGVWMEARKRGWPCVIPFEPRKCTERLARQQGLFLVPTDTGKPFMDNLYDAFGMSGGEKVSSDAPLSVLSDIDACQHSDAFPLIIKLVLPKSVHHRVRGDLLRMNITAEVLFPGLDGLTRSLVETARLA